MLNQRQQLKKTQLRNATALHEANFAKLARVVPGLHNLEKHMCIQGPGDSLLELRVVDISKYTKTFSILLKQHPSQPWLTALHMKVRNYYDASVTEVLAFQDYHRLEARYDYPNPNMHQCNEKWQTNQFLSEWLDHCLRNRCVFRDEIEFQGA